MKLKIFDYFGATVEVPDDDRQLLLTRLGDDNPRVSACLHCNSCVLAKGPFHAIIRTLNNEYSSDKEWIGQVDDILEETGSVHVYIWEENECIHRLWRDPLAKEWSGVTGEKVP